jgi:hypothetical protein
MLSKLIISVGWLAECIPPRATVSIETNFSRSRKNRWGVRGSEEYTSAPAANDVR